MKIKALISSLIAVTCLAFIACDDDLNTVGSGIRPDNDDIYIGTDSVSLTAATVSLNNSVYARADRALLGEYTDDLYGHVLSDYLCEFYSSRDSKFQDKTFKIDSVRLYVITSGFLGDRSKLMGLSAYAVANPLEEDQYTDINPADYADMSKTIGQGSFIFKDAPLIDPTNRPETHRMLTLNVDTIIGHRFLNEWKTNHKTFTDNSIDPVSKKSKFQIFFPGVYITPTFGDDVLMPVQQTILGVYYQYTGRNHDDTKDSTRVSALELDVSPRVVQMNRVQHQIDPSLLGPSNEKTYLKSPAGLYTELTIPLKDIITKVGKDRTINSASFHIKGFSEEEEKSSYQRPDYLLFINKDSIDTFFTDKRIENHTSSFLMVRDSINMLNTYQFSLDSYNINTMIEHYRKEYEKKNVAVADIPDLKYVLLPVERLAAQQGSSLSTAIYNLMEPRSAILRTDEKNMRLRFVFSKYASQNKKY